MKTLIISDVHLTHVFDEKKFIFLKKLFSSVDHIILNGDFWDGHSTTFDRFISSPWSQLFPLLKKKSAIYLYGNHDQKIFSDERTSLFSVEQKDHHLLTINTQTYHIEHGHILHPAIDAIFHFSRAQLRYINNFSHVIENILVTLGSPQNIVFKHANNEIKNKLKINKFPHWYISGHTHYAEVDMKNKFANSGFIQYGKASYLIVNSSGVTLRTESYK